MDVLRKRVADRMQLERRELRAEQMKLGKKRVAFAKEAARAHAVQEKLLAALRDGAAPTATVATQGRAAGRVLARVIREMEATNERMDAQALALAKLDEPDELERRVAHAHELGVTEKVLTGVQAAEIVLIRHGRALHVTDLTREALETGTVKLSGKTPTQTMSAYLAKEAAKPDGLFVRVAPGVFDMRNRDAKVATAKQG